MEKYQEKKFVKSLGDIRERGYEEQGEGLNPGENFKGKEDQLKMVIQVVAK